MLEGFRTATFEVVSAIESGANEAQNGAKLAEGADSAFKDIMSYIERITQCTHSLKESADSNAEISRETLKSVGLVTDAIHNVSASADQASKLSNAVKQQSIDHISLVDKFKL